MLLVICYAVFCSTVSNLIACFFFPILFTYNLHTVNKESINILFQSFEHRKSKMRETHKKHTVSKSSLTSQHYLLTRTPVSKLARFRHWVHKCGTNYLCNYFNMAISRKVLCCEYITVRTRQKQPAALHSFKRVINKCVVSIIKVRYKWKKQHTAYCLITL